MKKIKRIISFILVLSMVFTCNVFAYAESSKSTNKYSNSLLKESDNYKKYEIVNNQTGNKEYLIQETIGDDVVYKSITADNKIYTTKMEGDFVVVRDENNNVVEKLKAYEEGALIMDSSESTRASTYSTTSTYGPWDGYTWTGNSVVNTTIVSVLAAIIATLCGLNKGTSIAITIATAIISLNISIYFYKKTRNIRYSTDGLTLQEQYITKFYQNQDFTGYINTAYSDIVTRVMK